MKLGKLLDTDRILLDMKATEHLPAIIELVDLPSVETFRKAAMTRP
jgi:hypothetical protein